MARLSSLAQQRSACPRCAGCAGCAPPIALTCLRNRIINFLSGVRPNALLLPPLALLLVLLLMLLLLMLLLLMLLLLVLLLLVLLLLVLLLLGTSPAAAAASPVAAAASPSFLSASMALLLFVTLPPLRRAVAPASASTRASAPACASWGVRRGLVLRRVLSGWIRSPLIRHGCVKFCVKFQSERDLCIFVASTCSWTI